VYPSYYKKQKKETYYIVKYKRTPQTPTPPHPKASPYTTLASEQYISLLAPFAHLAALGYFESLKV
tara:strand:+ start:817 stop:1014 length:198 start_codon:yes stop_codon:yes gene_type:complete